MTREEKAAAIGTAGLVLGIVSVLYSIFVIGAFVGIAGIIISIIHLIKKMPYRNLAIWGLVLSLIGTAAGVALGFINVKRNLKSVSEYYQGGYREYYGKEAPDITLTTIDGNEFKLSEQKGKRVFIDFWATWCPPCKKELPELIRLRNEISPDKLVIIGISNESKKVISDFAKKNKINYPLASAGLDANLPGPYSEIESIPTLFVIDANGIIEDAVIGYHSYENLKEYAIGTRRAAD